VIKRDHQITELHTQKAEVGHMLKSLEEMNAVIEHKLYDIQEIERRLPLQFSEQEQKMKHVREIIEQNIVKVQQEKEENSIILQETNQREQQISMKLDAIENH